MTASLAIQFQKVGAPRPWQGEVERAARAGASGAHLAPAWSLAAGDSEQARSALYSVVMNPQLINKITGIINMQRASHCVSKQGRRVPCWHCRVFIRAVPKALF